MSKKTDAALYAISALLLLACPYAVPKVGRYFRDISSRTFRIMPWLDFLFAASLLLPVLLVAHIYFYQRLELPRKKVIELCLCALFALAAPLTFFGVIFIPGVFDVFAFVCCFLFVFTLLTALLFGKKQEVSAQPPRQ